MGRYVYDSFEGDYLSTIGTNVHVKMVKIDDLQIKLVIWDIGGQDDFALLRRAYYSNASGAFFVFDTTRAETIRRVDDWISTLFAVTGKIPLVLVENKVDLPSHIGDDVKKQLAQKFKVDFVSTSAKDDLNVEEAFTKMTREILSRARTRKANPAKKHSVSPKHMER